MISSAAVLLFSSHNYTEVMASKDQYLHAEIYKSSEIERYAQKTEKEPEIVAFLFPAIEEFFKSYIPGKAVLDIACGKGVYTYRAAQYGAKSVYAFDINKEMVQLAKQFTSQYTTVSVCVGNVKNMPYNDNMFDIALGIHTTVALPSDACISLFKEIHRVLVPGGKAMLNCHVKAAFEKLIVRSGGNKEILEKQINEKLSNLQSYPSENEINNAFEDLPHLIHVFFTLDENGRLHRITDANKLIIGQAVWSKNRALAYPNYYYDEQFIRQQIEAAGLKLDKIENYYTEERRIVYNGTDPEFELDKTITDFPIFAMYHLSKPVQ